MRFDELLWDEKAEEHIARHNVDPEEVDAVVFDPASKVFRVGPRGRPT